MSDLLMAPPWWYWLVGGVVTAWQGVRGWYFQGRFARAQNRQAAEVQAASAVQKAQALSQIAVQLHPIDSQAAAAAAQQVGALLAAPPQAEHLESECAICWMRCLEDALLYAVTTAAGFVALLLAYRTAMALNSVSDVSGGVAALLAFLATAGVVGVVGYLPYLIQLGKKLPW